MTIDSLRMEAEGLGAVTLALAAIVDEQGFADGNFLAAWAKPVELHPPKFICYRALFALVARKFWSADRRTDRKTRLRVPDATWSVVLRRDVAVPLRSMWRRHCPLDAQEPSVPCSSVAEALICVSSIRIINTNVGEQARPEGSASSVPTPREW